MSRLYIYGASAHASELAYFVRYTNLASMDFCGHIADPAYISDGFDMSSYSGDLSVLRRGDSLLIAVGRDLAFRRSLVGVVNGMGLDIRFPNCIHEDTVIANLDLMGEGNIVQCYCTFSTNVIIGNHNIFLSHCMVGHDSVIGSYNTICSASNLSGHAVVGDMNHFGGNSFMMPKSQIGSGNIIAPGSYIYKRFRDNCLVSGNPATATSLDNGGGGGEDFLYAVT